MKWIQMKNNYQLTLHRNVYAQRVTSLSHSVKFRSEAVASEWNC